MRLQAAVILTECLTLQALLAGALKERKEPTLVGKGATPLFTPTLLSDARGN